MSAAAPATDSVPIATSSTSFAIFIQAMGGQTVQIDVRATDTVMHCKRSLAREHADFAAARQKLVLLDETTGEFRVLRDDESLGESGIAPDATLHVVVQDLEAVSPTTLHSIEAAVKGRQWRELESVFGGQCSGVLNLVSMAPIGSDGAEALARALGSSSGIHKLFARNHEIGDAGAKMIAASLRGNRDVRLLDFAYNSISDAGGVDLAHALAENDTLETLDLTGNLVGDATCVALAETLCARNTRLTKVFLSYNKIGARGVAALADLMQHNERLVELSVLGSTSTSTDINASLELEAATIEIQAACRRNHDRVYVALAPGAASASSTPATGRSTSANKKKVFTALKAAAAEFAAFASSATHIVLGDVAASLGSSKINSAFSSKSAHAGHVAGAGIGAMPLSEVPTCNSTALGFSAVPLLAGASNLALSAHALAHESVDVAATIASATVPAAVVAFDIDRDRDMGTNVTAFSSARTRAHATGRFAHAHAKKSAANTRCTSTCIRSQVSAAAHDFFVAFQAAHAAANTQSTAPGGGVCVAIEA